MQCVGEAGVSPAITAGNPTDKLTLATQLREIFLMAEVPTFKLAPGEVLIRQGEASSSMYLIISGQLVLSRTEGHKTRAIGTLREGAVLGELSFLLGTTPNVSLPSECCRSAIGVPMVDCRLTTVWLAPTFSSFR